MKMQSTKKKLSLSHSTFNRNGPILGILYTCDLFSFSTELWNSILIVAVYFPLALNAVLLDSIRNHTADETGSGSNINSATIDGNRSGGKINNGTVEEIMEGDENEILFEDDIAISIENIHKFYDLNKDQEKELMSMSIGKSVSHVGRRAATSDEDMLWSHGIVPYVIGNNLRRRRNMIMEAMNAWSDSTCLHFIERTSERDYIFFTEHNKDWSISAVGRTGRKQLIKLSHRLTKRNVMHEIGHALGFRHEQSRPDRDSYVTVYWDNIQSGKRSNFEKRNEKEVDYQGTEYDYGSIMHYKKTVFLKKNDCTGSCLTLEENNPTVYRRQGSPEIGEETQLSNSDIEQVNRLYSCPNPGEQGFLLLYIQNGVNLEDTDFFGKPDPYVTVKAISSTGSEYHEETSHKQGTRYPTWNEWLFFSDKQWQFFRIRVWDSNIGDHETMGMSRTISLLNMPRNSMKQKYCTNTPCNRYIRFDYKLLTPVRGYLQVKLRFARNLPDTTPDPYTSIRAIRSDGSSSSKRTISIPNTRNPTWNQWLGMDGCEFVGFMVQIWDDDRISDDEISDPEFIKVSSGYNSGIKHCVSTTCHSYLYLDYELKPDGNECDTSPCYNGGTCIDGCSSYFCSCISSYTGDRCQYRQGRLTFYARYGRNLPDEDGWLAGNSDPYIRFVAYDVYGNSYEKTTITDQGDEDPEWYQNIDFGTRPWRRFEVSVWDDDVDDDDRLSSTRTWYLPSTRSGSANFVKLNAYKGFVKFDYMYT